MYACVHRDACMWTTELNVLKMAFWGDSLATIKCISRHLNCKCMKKLGRKITFVFLSLCLDFIQ